ncbi:MAG: serine/threonine-protein kinase, partial [Myxococcota bacterium]|nr:serine/threonine-protein kinase [Myxococcota bacterium]
MKRDAEVLGQLGRYQLLRRLGRGANAEVFLAEFEGPGGFRKQVALKRYFDQQQRPGFTQEAKLGGALRHFNLVELLDIFEDQEGNPLLVLEYINGPSVAQLLERYHALPPLIVFELAQQLLRGLEHGHRQLGLVHRDLKPENLLIDYESAQLKIADFGIAVSEHSDPEGEQWIVGTPPYMSPEQIRLDPLDGRSDLFAVGSIL